MRSLIFAAIFLGNMTAFANCPDISGKYRWDLPPSDGRIIYQFKITQNGCNSITLSDWYVRWVSGSESRSKPDEKRTDLIDGQLHDGTKNSWVADGIETIHLNITRDNVGECNEHGTWKINPSKNSLDYIWRFECSGWNSAWFMERHFKVE